MSRELPKDWRQSFKLTDDFLLSEFCVSNSYPELAAQIDPSPREVDNLHTLCKFYLQKVRSEFGKTQVTSGIRRGNLNKMLGGVSSSQHCFGEAADFLCPHVEMKTVFEWSIDMLKWPGELIYYKKAGHVHVALPSVWSKADQFIKT